MFRFFKLLYLAKWRAHRDQCLAGLAKLKRDAQR